VRIRTGEGDDRGGSRPEDACVKTEISEPSQRLGAIQRHVLGFSYCRFSEIVIILAHPASAGGAYRDRHGRWKRDAMDALARETNAFRGGRLRRVVLIPRRWDQVGGDDPPAMVARKPGRQGEHAICVKTIAQGRPGVLGCTCGSYPVRYLLHGGHGRQPAPGLPCAFLHPEGEFR
jgi:hypothetical protein